MRRLTAGALCSLGAFSFAQQPAQQTATEVFRLKGGSRSIRLKHGDVVKESVHIEVAGKTIKPGTDFWVDANGGNVQIYSAGNPDDAIVITYNYLGVAPNTAVSAKQAGFTLQHGPTLAFSFSNPSQFPGDTGRAFGFTHNFASGGLSSLGIFAGLTGSAPGTKDSNAQFVAQNISGKLGSGLVSFNYRRAGRGFSNFDQVNGLTDEQMVQAQKEVGLVRSGFDANNLAFGNAKLNFSQQQVEDAGEAVKFQKFGADMAGFKFSASKRSVSSGFKRFSDLGEQDRDALSKETGLRLHEFAVTGNHLDANRYLVSEADGRSVKRDSVGLTASHAKVRFFTQFVDPTFTRFGDLRDAQKSQLARELGLHRQGVEANFTNGSFANLQTLTANDTRATQQDAHALVGPLIIDHIVTGSDKAFTMLPNLASDEQDRVIKRLAGIELPGFGTNAGERGPYATSGVERRWDQASLKFGSLTFSALGGIINNDADKLSANTFSLSGNGFTAGLRKQHNGANFGDIGTLMDFEQQKFSKINDLDSRITEFAYNRNGNKLEASSYTADLLTDQAQASHLAYSGAFGTFTGNWRTVTAGFTRAGELPNPDAGNLASAVGKQQHDLAYNIKPFAGLQITGSSAKNQEMASGKVVSQDILNLVKSFGNAASIEWYSSKSQTVTGTDFDSYAGIQRLTLNLGTAQTGKFKFGQESGALNGKLVTLPDYHRTYVGYEKQFSDRTALSLQSDNFRYIDGTYEGQLVATLSQKLTNRFGVKFSSVAAEKSGLQSEKVTREMGFWADLGGGVKVDMGVQRNLNGDATGNQNQAWTVTPGKVGGVEVGPSSYSDTRTDGQPVSATSSWSVKTSKGYCVGPVKDLNFSVGGDAKHANETTQAENRNYGLSGLLGALHFGVNYKSQLDVPTQQRAIVRAFHFDVGDTKAFVYGRADYKLRTLQDGTSDLSRDFGLNFNLGPTTKLTNTIVTLPEQANGSAILGSSIQNFRKNEWKLNNTFKKFEANGTYMEQFADNVLTRSSGLDFVFNKASGSPVTFFFGYEQGSAVGGRFGTQRFNLRWDQRPSDNQSLSLGFGNYSRIGLAPNLNTNLGVSLQLEYRLRF